MSMRIVRKAAEILLVLAFIASLGVSALASSEEPSFVSGAILYRITDGILEYNVTHTAPLASGVSVSGSGIVSVDGLEALMGEIDAPAPVTGTDHSGRTIGAAITADLTLDPSGAVSEIRITSVSERPVIGISWKRDDIGADYQGFAEAFERGGALAVFLPQLTSAADAQAVLSVVDGVFVTGGEDWNPSLYGDLQTPHGSSGWNDVRDASDIHLMQQAIALDVPMLCVCRAEQGLNVALGGALIQDIPYYLGQRVLAGEIDVSRVTDVLSGTLPGSGKPVRDTGYTMYDDNYDLIGRTYTSGEPEAYLEGSGCEEGHLRVQVDGIVHSGGTGYHILNAGVDGVGVSRDSKWLYDILGSDTVELVATAHHQAADPERIGKGLSVAAISSDGIIEALEYRDNTFALAVQWHPERDALGDARGVDVDQDLCNALLGALIEYSRLAAAASPDASAEAIAAPSAEASSDPSGEAGAAPSGEAS